MIHLKVVLITSCVCITIYDTSILLHYSSTLCVYACMCVCVCVRVCACAFTYVCMCYALFYVCMCVCVHMCMCMCVCVHARIYVCMCYAVFYMSAFVCVHTHQHAKNTCVHLCATVWVFTTSIYHGVIM